MPRTYDYFIMTTPFKKSFEEAFKQETIGTEGHAEALWAAKWALEKAAMSIDSSGAQTNRQRIREMAKELE